MTGVRRQVRNGVTVAGVPWLVGAVSRGSLHWRRYGPLDAVQDYAVGACVLAGAAFAAWLYTDAKEDQ